MAFSPQTANDLIRSIAQDPDRRSHTTGDMLGDFDLDEVRQYLSDGGGLLDMLETGSVAELQALARLLTLPGNRDSELVRTVITRAMRKAVELADVEPDTDGESIHTYHERECYAPRETFGVQT